MASDIIIQEIFPHCLQISLNRPAIGNALSPQLISELTKAFLTLSDATRIVVLSGEGKAFCTGADLTQMQAAIHASKEKNEADAIDLATLLKTIASCHKPVIAFAHGSVFGGGVGLLGACDFVLVEATTKFCFSEVKLGLIPAVISPYIVQIMGPSRARKLFLSAAVFSAQEAHHWGLVDEIVEEGSKQTALENFAKKLMQGGPQALTAVKKLVPNLPTKEAFDHTVRLIAAIRLTEEAQEGMAAFFEKRAPHWPQEKES